MPERIRMTADFEKIRDHVHFILVEPDEPGNIGAAARALKTTGFRKLVLVNPRGTDRSALVKMAHRSLDIIESARVVSSCEEALASMRLAVATTMRRRRFDFPLFTPLEISRKLLPLALEHPVALVFGRESTGLTNEDLYRCHLHSTIPTAIENPALNLAQAVMIYAHTLFTELNEIPESRAFDPATQEELEIFYGRLSAALKSSGFVSHDGIDNFIVRFKRLIGRSLPERRDVRLLHKLIRIFETGGPSKRG